MALYMAVVGLVNPGGGRLVDNAVEIGSTAAIADSTALELVCALKP